jgi:hypothetical protein
MDDPDAANDDTFGDAPNAWTNDFDKRNDETFGALDDGGDDEGLSSAFAALERPSQQELDQVYHCNPFQIKIPYQLPVGTVGMVHERGMCPARSGASMTRTWPVSAYSWALGRYRPWAVVASTP